MQKQDLLNTQIRIKAFIHNTIVLTSQQLNTITKAKLYFKCENFQKMGAFKMRGATNAILQLTDAQKQKGVVTHSSGNFAQAIALSANNIGIKAYIVMPKNAPKVKIDAVLGYGGIITFCESIIEARQQTADKIVSEKGATFIHPSNDINVILGNATACLELIEKQPNLDYIIVPIGGGGLIAGTSLATHFFTKNCKVIGAEPLEANDAFRSLKSGKIEKNKTANTIADGLRTHLGDINFPIIQQYASQIITVSETEIKDALHLIYNRLKIVVEPSSAVSLAVVLKEKEIFKNKKVGIILSGGNVDLRKLSSII